MPHEESYVRLHIGDRVRCYSESGEHVSDGSVRCLGLDGADGNDDADGTHGVDLIGVELDMAKGKSNGPHSHTGIRYFECAPFHGAFLARPCMEQITGSDARRSPQGTIGYSKAGREPLFL